MDKKQVIKILTEIAVLLELKDENPFKIRAYQNAARALETSSINLDQNTTLGQLTAIKGIGSSTAHKILALVKEGELDLYQNLAQSVPPGLVEMLKIPTLGPKKIKFIYEVLNIDNISELELACQENKLAGLPNFGFKTQENVLNGIKAVKIFSKSFLYADIYEQAHGVLEGIRKHNMVKIAHIAGSMRRKKEIVKDVDIVAATDNPGNIMKYFISLDQAAEIIAHGDKKTSIKLDSGINVDMRAVKPNQYPYALHHFTGSKEHNTAMRSMSRKMGIKINEYGLFRNGKLIKCENEHAFFKVFSMDYIPPELRENYGELEAARNGKLPRLVAAEQIKGIFHIHTRFSDGNMTIMQACRKLQEMGMEYAGISEHSKTAAYARGLKQSSIQEYLKEIEKAEQELEGFTVFKGIESDILPNGDLDYSDDILKLFDFVIIAIHSHFNMSEEAMTERIIKATQKRHATMLAHPSGRILLARDPYKVNILKIIDAAAKNNVGLEINANPHRLDLDWRMLKYAKDKKIKLFINPDAHHLENLNDYIYGINIARKGWLEASDVANTMGVDKMKEYLKVMKGKLL